MIRLSVGTRIMPALLTLGTLALGSCGGSQETLAWDPGTFVLAAKEPTGWKSVNGNATFRLLYAKQGETADNWTQKAEVTELPIAITLGGKVHWNPRSMLTNEQKRVHDKGCSTDGWSIVGEDSTSILYEWRDIRCTGYLHQHELGRIVMGRWHMWFVSYGIRGRPFSPEERERLVATLAAAKVVGS